MKKLFCIFLFCLISTFSFSTICYATELAGTTSIALEGIGNVLSNNLNSSQTFGEAVSVGDYTVIPVISKSVIFGFGTKLEDLGRSAKKNNAGNSESKAKNRIALGACGQSKPVALIFIGKNGDFKVVKLDDGFVNQLAKYIAPKIPEMIRKLIEYKKKYFSSKVKKHRSKKSHKKVRKNKKIHKKSKSLKHRMHKRNLSREHYLNPRQIEMKKAHQRFIKNRKFPKHEILRKERYEKRERTD